MYFFIIWNNRFSTAYAYITYTLKLFHLFIQSESMLGTQLQQSDCISHKPFQLSPPSFIFRASRVLFFPGKLRNSSVTSLPRVWKAAEVPPPQVPWFWRVCEEPRSHSAGTMWARLVVAVEGSMPRASRSGFLRASGAGGAGRRQQRPASSAEVHETRLCTLLEHFWSLWFHLKTYLKVG